MTGLTIPTDPAERAALQQQLAVYIEHSDGDKELVQGELVAYRDGTYGIKFHINKFSTFTVVRTNAFQKTSAVTKVENGFAPLRLKAEGQKTSQKLTFTKVTGADGYIVYGNSCGIDNHLDKIADISSKTTSYWVKGLKADIYYKYQVKAYKVVNGKKVIIAVSKIVHSTTESKKYTNPTKVTTSTSTVSLKVGKTQTLKCSVVSPEGKKVAEHVAVIRYESTNSKIATINSKGVITSKGKGTCYIYAYAQNGVYVKIKVTVK